MDYMHKILDVDYEDEGYYIADLKFNPVPAVKAKILELLPFGQKLFVAATLEKLERSQLSDISQGYPHISQLGVKMDKMEEVMPWILSPWRDNRYFHGPTDPKTVPLRPLTRVEEEQILIDAQQKPLKSLLGL